MYEVYDTIGVIYLCCGLLASKRDADVRVVGALIWKLEVRLECKSLHCQSVIERMQSLVLDALVQILQRTAFLHVRVDLADPGFDGVVADGRSDVDLFEQRQLLAADGAGVQAVAEFRFALFHFRRLVRY